MQAAPLEDLERLEADVQVLRDAIVDLLEVYLLTDNREDLAAAVRVAHKTLKERTTFRPAFELEWGVGPDAEIRFEPEDDSD